MRRSHPLSRYGGKEPRRTHSLLRVEALESRQLLSTTSTVNTTADAMLSPREAIEVANGTLAFSSFSQQEPGTPPTIDATYNGDTTFAPSTVPTRTRAVNPMVLISTTTALSSSQNPSTLGQSVTFTATVTPSSGTTSPTGTVTFSIDGVDQPPVDVIVIGGVAQALFGTSSLAVGTHTIGATYSGDSTYATSTAPTLTQTVNATNLITTLTALSTSQNRSLVGQSVTFTAVVTPSATVTTNPSGAITFSLDGVAQAPVGVTMVNGVTLATFTPAAPLTVGTHTIDATYSGDTAYATSTARTLFQTVLSGALISTTTTLTSSLNPSTEGQSVTFTATVTPNSGKPLPTGTMTFTIDGVNQTPVVLSIVNGVAQARFTTSTLTVGDHTIDATFSGTDTYATSTAPLLTQTVSPVVDGPRALSLVRIGVHTQPTQLVLTFNQPLDAASAQDLANYRLFLIGAHGQHIAPLRLRAVVYDNTTNTVTLYPKALLSLKNIYGLVVNGATSTGVKDTSGNLLDGAGTGSPGSDYVRVFGSDILVASSTTTTTKQRQTTVVAQHRAVVPAGPIRMRR